MRFACPASTSLGLSGANTHSNVPTNHGLRNNHRRTRLMEKERNIKVTQAAEAKKKREKRQQAQDRAEARTAEMNYVFVGNIESSITQDRLRDFFLPCGQVTRVIVRCSRGQAITAGIAVPLAVRSERDRQYATVEFTDCESAGKALKYHGRVLDGCQLLVTASPSNLPEVHEIVNSHLRRLRQIGAFPPPKNKLKKPERPLTAAYTERFIDYNEPNNDYITIFGFRLPKCIA
ncbi:hypothetical protein CPB84DRAFT_1757695 [Gymnopilus junonius]|uniref:RRM domain-containing protein n=1 Tax=Gymnopilus junonius TaxID=109634 RepID=A0A9P5NYI0_GYMJU|nr:hypothetical protein CPB84DRAFT_1757695 [Gymnopilus junonius]